MKNRKAKITTIIVIFLAVMLFLTIISNKVDYMMTPEVVTTQAGKGDLAISINTDALIVNGFVSFNLNMEKESLIQVGDSVQVEFVNGEYQKEANVIEKNLIQIIKQWNLFARLLEKQMMSMKDKRVK